MSGLLRWGSVTGMNRTMTVPLAATTLAAALAGLAGCTGTPSIGKSGAVNQAVTVITLQMPDAGDPDGTYFAQDVARRSHGTLEVHVDGNSYASTLPANEARLVAALRAGRVGFSYQPARDWAAAGVPGFQALDTPFLVTTALASEALAASPVAAALLRQLTPLGLVGIGLIPAQPRQFLSVRPLITPSAFDGISLRINDNPQTAALVGALGAHPVQGKSASQAGDLLRSGSIAGVETSPQYVLDNSYNVEASYLTAFGIFPKFQTIIASASAWRKLTAAQQAAMRQAAADTLAYADRTVTSLEQRELAGLCTGGLVLDEPSPAQLAALAHKTASAAPAGAAAAAMTQMIRADVSGLGPQPAAVPPPPQCRTAGTAAQAIALHHLSTGGGPEGQTATIPPGTYVTTDTVADFENGGVFGPDWNEPITWTWHLYPNGTFYQTQQPDYPDQPFGRGRYVVKGDEVTFSYEKYMDEAAETLRWSYYDGQLTFSIVNVQDEAARVLYTAHPWRKAG
jgi:TRAP-type C4-dicarboxylate transport system substrate-binding protein